MAKLAASMVCISMYICTKSHTRIGLSLSYSLSLFSLAYMHTTAISEASRSVPDNANIVCIAVAYQLQNC
jgi:hypothetical protein